MSTFSAPVSSVERHPPGLFLLFFVEMWERFSFYGMRALLVFYLTKDFLKASDDRAYGIYGAYGALVYATPFIGGLVADKILGTRLAIILGGLLMAAGHCVMTVRSETALFMALGLLILGNGFFKPNISTMVGALYPKASQRRDSGFTIFYIGINLGAGLAPLVCGYIGETYGWHYGFGLATIGMLVGVVTFVAPAIFSTFLIMTTAIALTILMVWSTIDDRLQLLLNAPVALALLIAAGVAAIQLRRGTIPSDVGRAPPSEKSLIPGPPLVRFAIVAAAALLVLPGVAYLVNKNEIAGWVLIAFGVVALAHLIWGMMTSNKVERERLIVVLVLLFFSMLFWAIFEQAGSSVNNFTDRNVDRVVGDAAPTVGQRYDHVIVTQEFYGQTVPGTNGDRVWELADIAQVQKDRLDALKTDPNTTVGTVSFTATDQKHALIGVGGNELKASVFQAVNPICIMLFGLIFSALWGWLGRRQKDPSAPLKFALGLMQLGLGFGVLWWGAEHADSMGMVAVMWLILSYVLVTTGELCLSPVGLSLVTKLSPMRMASTVMGTWFLATAFSHYLGGAIAKMTGGSGHGGDANAVPPPWETVDTYGTVFGQLGIVAIAAGFILVAGTPLLKKWMHLEGDAAKTSAH